MKPPSEAPHDLAGSGDNTQPPPLTIPAWKASLRLQLKAILSAMPAEDRVRESSAIQAVIRASAGWRSASGVLGFVPLRSEPDLLELLRERARGGGLCCVPRWNPSTEDYDAAVLPEEGGLVAGPYGVLEPAPSLPRVPWERLDLILVPGLGFDRRGWRLGRGRGHFDRLLRRVMQSSRWGIAFDRQIVAQIPTEPHDVNVHFLVTPRLGLMATER